MKRRYRSVRPAAASLSFAALLAAACAPNAAVTAPPLRTSPPPAVDAAGSPAAESPPGLRLPGDVRPSAQRIELTLDPAAERFAGVTEIDVTLDRARRVIWLHGRGLHVTRATVTLDGGPELPAAWAEQGDVGLASLTLPQEVPLGRAKVRIAYDAPFGTALEGLYKATQAGVPYAFTQFESTSARLAFPCFDEPSFKIPFDLTLIVPKEAQAIANTREVGRTVDGAHARVRFATTLPIPSYLVAFAVGSLDVVPAADVPANAARKHPLPLRGIAARGRGKELAYALAHTGEILQTLEAYFGIEYPYDKLDILAVPDKGGAMENPGAVTFSEWLLLMDPRSASVRQKRRFASVTAHELAHQWFGDLVTMAWWDDTWLNEAFATWMGAKAADAWNPGTRAGMNLVRGAVFAMDNDSRVSARAIRQPIASPDDIANAFDTITYDKGGAVLGMFERWVGAEAFQRGIRAHLTKHSFGNATADDLLAALSTASGKDVKTPFHTFLDQPGVPFLEAEVRCDGAPRLHLKQSRYLPIGTKGDASAQWQVPVCARFAVGHETKEACTLLTEREGDLALGGTCPDWVMPNAGASGYYRFALAPSDAAKLRKAGVGTLSPRERVLYADSLYAGAARGALPMKDALEGEAALANDPEPEVVGEAVALLESVRQWFHGDALEPAVEAYVGRLFAGAYRKVGWSAGKGEDDDRTQLRRAVVTTLARVARDQGVRGEARRRGLAYLGYKKDGAIHREAVDPDLANLALAVVGESADVPLWDAIRAHLAKTDDEALREGLLAALGSARSPELAARARALALDPSLRVTEALEPVWSQLADPDLREATWAWIKEHFDALVARVSPHRGGAGLLGAAGWFCDEAHAVDLERFASGRVSSMEGGPRILAATLEKIRLCAALRAAQEPSARELFGARKQP